MRIRALPIVYRAVWAGVEAGLMKALEEGKKPENADNPDLIKEIVAGTVIQYLVDIIDFGDDMKMFTFPNEHKESPPEDPGY